ncbi:MAG: D-alanyl-D-alanine carboxypeptidase/D-alanyl-D-alanine-endopeptidase [Pyrinomonadaceae bacterium]
MPKRPVRFAILIAYLALIAPTYGDAQSTTALPTPPTSTSAVQTLSDLSFRLGQSLAKPEVQRGSVGVRIASLASGKVVFEQNAEKYFMPASNMKNYTVAAALDRLGPDYRIITSIYAPTTIDSEGLVKGDLRVFGRGDVSMSTRFNGVEDPMRSVDAVVDRIVAAGIKKIDGSIVGDDSFFRGFAIPQGWEWDDLQWSYGSEVSGLPINDSVVGLSVTAGPSGYSCNVKIVPFNPVIRVMNQCLTGPAGSRRTLKIQKKLDQNVFELTGSLPIGDSGFSGSVSVSRPAELFAALLRQRLIERGVTVSGAYRYEKRSDGSLPSGIEVLKIESAPLAVITANTMKPSQNMYTETLLWTLGELDRNATMIPGGGATLSTADSAELGLAAVKKFLTGIGVTPDAIIQYDGSGLSRHNLVTPASVVQVYTYMAKQSRYSQAWRDSLTIGGVDGTLRNRFRGTRANNNIRGKTGTIDQVSALSGYVTTASGEELVFSMIVNGVPQTSARTALLDEMVNHLANFTGRVD